MASSVTCTGCLYGELNQLGHMDPGGCLYEEEELLEVPLAAGAAAPPEEPAPSAGEESEELPVVYLTAAELEDEVVWPCRGIGVPPEMWAQLTGDLSPDCCHGFTREQLEDVLALPYQMGNTTPISDNLWATLLENFT